MSDSSEMARCPHGNAGRMISDPAPHGLVSILTAECLCCVTVDWDFQTKEQAEAAALRAWSALCSHAAPVGTWVSVKEGLPDTDGHYLTWDGHDVLEAYYYPGNEDWSRWRFGGQDMIDATHWQSLPQPPKADGAG